MCNRTVTSLLLVLLALTMIFVGAASSAADDPTKVEDPIDWSVYNGTGTADPNNNCGWWRDGCDDPLWKKGECHAFTHYCVLNNTNVTILGLAMHAYQVVGKPTTAGSRIKGTTIYEKPACGIYTAWQTISAVGQDYFCFDQKCYKVYYYISPPYCLPITQ